VITISFEPLNEISFVVEDEGYGINQERLIMIRRVLH